jgi:hypothetical protein
MEAGRSTYLSDHIHRDFARVVPMTGLRPPAPRHLIIIVVVNRNAAGNGRDRPPIASPRPKKEKNNSDQRLMRVCCGLHVLRPAERTPAMTEHDPLTISRKLFAAWNAHDADAWLADLAPDFVYQSDSLPQSIVRGHDGARTIFTTYVTAFPDLRFDIEQEIVSGPWVVVRW